MRAGERSEQMEQRRALIVVERCKEPALYRFGRCGGTLLELPSLRRQDDDIASSVPLVALARQQALALEMLEDAAMLPWSSASAAPISS